MIAKGFLVGAIWLVWYFDQTSQGLLINLGVTVGLLVGSIMDLDE